MYLLQTSTITLEQSTLLSSTLFLHSIIKRWPQDQPFPLWTLARSLYQCMACLCECACMHAGRDEKDVEWSVAPAVYLYQ